MGKIVVDTYAMIAFFYDEDGAKTVEDALCAAKKRGGRVLICAVNYGEVFYAVMKKSGNDAALKVRDMMDGMPLTIIPADRELSLLAGSIKAKKKMSYADCFCAALAMVHEVAVLTGDKEFREVEGEIAVKWIK
ncbi:MAG: type II toxin-antitoxin system VapC family toxin [Spirochaetia bacterium]|nr:type II toxin-antitoxin system VapC family toxin [Spirochaetia bacterium]